MSLAAFILKNEEDILEQWDAFAASLFPSESQISRRALRDHAHGILTAIVADIQTPQSKSKQIAKSKGHAPEIFGAPETAAETHAVLRAHNGLDINQLAAEYRALRASVLRLWVEKSEFSTSALQEMIRFNEAIDQSLAESINFFNQEVERSRNLLLGTIGHDMRTPLNAIVLTAADLSTMDAGEEVAKAAKSLKRSGAAIQNLLNDLVDYNRITLAVGISIEPIPIVLGDVLEEEVKQLQDAYPRHTIQFKKQDNVCGSWDGPRLQQVLRNLVSNACVYGRHEEPIKIDLYENVEGVCFDVANVGTEIDPQKLEVLLKPMVRGKVTDETTNKTSLGLGLYIVHGVAAAHGGRVLVRSEDGWTIFSVQLPRICKAQTV